jgi:cytosine permease
LKNLNSNELTKKLGMEQVPKNKKQNWHPFVFIKGGNMISITALMTGGLLVSEMSLRNAIITSIIGFALIAILFIFQGIQGQELGVATSAVSTLGFGERGSRYIITTLLIASTIGWYSITANVCGTAFSSLLETSFSIYINEQLSIFIWGIIMFSTAIFGLSGLKYLNYISVPLMSAVIAYGISRVLSANALNTSASITSQGMSIGQGVGTIIGAYAVWTICAPDITQYQKSKKGVIISSVFGIIPVGVIMITAGGILALAAGITDLSQIFVNLGIPIFGLVALIFSAWPVNTVNAYSGGLNILKLLKLNNSYRVRATIFVGILGAIIGSFNIVNYFKTIISWFGIAIVPIGGVMIMAYLIHVFEKSINKREVEIKKTNFIGIISWVSGVIVSLILPIGIQSLNGIAISSIMYVTLYWANRRSCKIESTYCS